METINAKDLGIELNLDTNRYSVLTKKKYIGETDRVFYICHKEQLEDSSISIMTYFTKPECDKIEIWEKEVTFMESSISVDKVSEDIELITEQGDPTMKLYRYLVPFTMQRKDELVEIKK